LNLGDSTNATRESLRIVATMQFGTSARLFQLLDQVSPGWSDGH
jgi:hypothetical protein